VIRGVRVTVAVIILALGMSSCRDWNRAPYGPILQPAFGARVTDGRLEIWPGPGCVGITRVGITFEPSNAQLVLNSSDKQGVDLDRFELGGPYPAGLQVSKPLPVGYDWRTSRSIRLSLDGGSSAWGTATDTAEVVKGSPNHADGTFWFQDVGWLNSDEVVARNGKTFLASCTHNPPKK